jgi:hypothetical protein
VSKGGEAVDREQIHKEIREIMGVIIMCRESECRALWVSPIFFKIRKKRKIFFPTNTRKKNSNKK